ncbi:Uncharacterised protein [Vibrio cholerae]|nr:Uncharacterised protein [Vibrio cholerae]
MHVAIQRADHRRRDYAFWCPTNAVHHVHFTIGHTGQNRCGDIAIRHCKNAYAHLLHLRNHLVVARFGKRDHHQIG